MVGIDRPAFDYGPLLLALKESIAERNLQPIPIFLLKNIELYEMVCVRHGLMVVGPTGGGKSSNVRVLCSALTKLKQQGVVGERYEKSKIFHLNPKSIRMGQLYGEFDENTVRSHLNNLQFESHKPQISRNLDSSRTLLLYYF